MVLKDIIAISGQQGLFKFIAQGKNSMIVEHIETGKRTSAFSSVRVSSLEEISIFTENEDLPLSQVFDKIYEKENGGLAVDPKSDPVKLKKYFEDIVPEYSRDKVYVSDIKKVFLWYNILQRKNLLVKEEVKEASEPETQDDNAKNVTPKEGKSKKARNKAEEIKGDQV